MIILFNNMKCLICYLYYNHYTALSTYNLETFTRLKDKLLEQMMIDVVSHHVYTCI